MRRKRIEEALRSMECPYSLASSESMFPVAQWLLDRVGTSQSDRDDEVLICYLLIRTRSVSFALTM